jgi:hypothetical protein
MMQAGRELETDARARLRRALLWSSGLTVALWIIPLGDRIGYPLYLLSTLVHELGHGLTAELVGGDFSHLKVATDGSGVAFSSVTGSVQRALVAAGGLVGPAVAALLGFAAGRRATTARIGLFAIALLTAVATLLWVRSWVGVLVAVSVSLGCGAAALAPARRPGVPQLVLLFLSVQLALSVFSRSEYLFTQLSTSTGGQSRSDSEAIADVLLGPYWFWGAVCGLFSVAVLLLGGRMVLRSARGPAAPMVLASEPT